MRGTALSPHTWQRSSQTLLLHRQPQHWLSQCRQSALRLPQHWLPQHWPPQRRLPHLRLQPASARYPALTSHRCIPAPGTRSAWRIATPYFAHVRPGFSAGHRHGPGAPPASAWPICCKKRLPLAHPADFPYPATVPAGFLWRQPPIAHTRRTIPPHLGKLISNNYELFFLLIKHN